MSRTCLGGVSMLDRHCSYTDQPHAKKFTKQLRNLGGCYKVAFSSDLLGRILVIPEGTMIKALAHEVVDGNGASSLNICLKVVLLLRQLFLEVFLSWV